MRWTLVLPLILMRLLAPVAPSPAADTARVTSGLLALYTFDEKRGDRVRDRSRVGRPIDLRIAPPQAARWTPQGLAVHSSATIMSVGPARKLIEIIKRSREATIEAWIQPEHDRQGGPARIVSLSSNPSNRNLTLGQEKSQFDVRVRTTSTSANGIPATVTATGTAVTARTHVVYTRDATGSSSIYIDGKLQATPQVAGELSNWDPTFPLVLANEATGNRPWLGTLYLVAIYGRALTADEVAQNLQAGASPGAPAAAAQVRPTEFFQTRIAPLLAQRCLECHDARAMKGGLDLSRKATTLAGGESGKAIIPGKSAASRLWKRIDKDEMPDEGAPLSPVEKWAMRKWIDEGAVWVGGAIDPSTYLAAGPAGDIWVQRLTVAEYIETVRVAVGVDLASEARQILPADVRADGFSNTAYNLQVDLKHIESYARLAEIAVKRMDVLKFAARFSKRRELSTDASMRKLVAAMGKWLLRGPLDEREITNYSGVATTVASAGGDFEEAVTWIVEAMLQSPRFLYRIEYQLGDGTRWPVSDFELASRLSYIIWGSPPDRELMRAADAGALHDRAHVASQVRRMLTDPRAIAQSARFMGEWLDLDRLQHLRPDPRRFPEWDAALAADMRRETLAFFQEVVWKQDRPLGDLFNAQFTFATPRLARHYGWESRGPGLHRYDLSSIPARGGLLTQASTLTIGGDDASMVTRGLFVFKDLLRGEVKEPPPGVDTTPVPLKAGLSQRQISERRIANRACSGCHARIEPLAFGLEKFDGVGAFRESDEHGNRLREDGTILFPNTAQPQPYRSVAGLMSLLAGSPRVRETLTWKVTQFCLGRPLVAADVAEVAKINQTSSAAGGTYRSLILAIVTSDLVMMTRTQDDPQTE